MNENAAPSLASAPGGMRNSAYRITSIDLLRGLVMIIMALDHTRDFFHIGAMKSNPLDANSTTIPLFFTRWITHYCAPTFVFLSGLSAYLSSQKKSSREASSFLVRRGVWLILVEMIVVSLGLTFDIGFHFIIWQVIWVIGCSMILLAIARLLPNQLTLLIGCLLFFCHDLFNYSHPPQPGATADMITVLFTAFNNFVTLDPTHVIGDFYAILPWTGVMMIGYGIGDWFKKEYPAKKRKRNLLVCGLSLISLFIILRFINKYGDPSPRLHIQGWRGILSFLNTSKYPPSLMFCCMTLGPSFVFLALSENIKTAWARIASVYGKVPFFYYILHFYILHIVLVIAFYATGHTGTQIHEARSFIYFRPVEFGFNLLGTYAIWLSVVASLYFPCRWFYNYKVNHQQWWLKYL